MRNEYNRYWYHQFRQNNSNGCSTYLFLMAFALLCLVVAGCRTHKAVTDESGTVSIVDTTQVETDSLTATQTFTDTTQTTTTTEQNTTINFVDGGGTVSIDSAGNITLTGVQSITGNLTTNTNQQNGISQTNEVTQTHTDTQNGITNNESHASHTEKEAKTEKPVWYQTILAKIGGLCCIAALLWLLFLYLKRKF